MNLYGFATRRGPSNQTRASSSGKLISQTAYLLTGVAAEEGSVGALESNPSHLYRVPNENRRSSMIFKNTGYHQMNTGK
ncbi:MAG TPA: hypothetical protein DD473_18290 [Planctomycetaceae bacterium]|nr:hypothetical protein [Planctomycetaceae bacterium]